MQSHLRVALVALLALVATAAAVSAHRHVNPLSLIRVENIRTKLGAGRISIDAPLLTGTGTAVNVSWSGLPVAPGKQDWIGVYSPKPVSYSATAPTKYKYVSSDASGSGITELWLVNMRASYVVVYYTGGLKDPVLIAESAPVDFENYHLPLHLHMSLTGDPTQMRLEWNSAQNAFPSVNWGDAPDNLNNSILRVRTTTYTVADMCGPPASTVGWHEPGFMHSALIEGLTPGKQYFYQVGDESAHSQSEVESFWAPPVQAPDTDVDFIIFGDLGQIEPDGSSVSSESMKGSILVTLAMAADYADGSVSMEKGGGVFHIGDISYSMGYGSVWEQFFYQIAPMSAHVPWMTVDGNHERDWPGSGSYYNGTDSGGECGVAYESRFTMPSPVGAAPGQTWWSVNYGPVHTAVISTEMDFWPGSPQYEWLAADFARVDRSKTPFLLLMGHRPMYIDSTNNNPSGGDLPVAAELRAALEPLLYRYKVDAAFWGHHHSYQRTCAAQNLTCARDPSEGTVHIVTGAAGPPFSQNVQSPTPAWIMYENVETNGYVRAHVRNGGRTLTLDFVAAKDRTVIDTVTIKSKFARGHKDARRVEDDAQRISLA